MATHSSMLESDPKLTLKFHLEAPCKPPSIPHLYQFILNPAPLLSLNHQHNSQNTIFWGVRVFFKKKKKNNFLFYIEIQPINNVVTVSGGEQGTQPHINTYPFSPRLPSRLPHNNKQSSTCYIVSPCGLSIFNISAQTCPSQTPQLSLT